MDGKAAGRGGIGCRNSRYWKELQPSGRFPSENLRIETQVIEAAREMVQGDCYFGSSCIYPKFAEQPIREESLLTGALKEPPGTQPKYRESNV